MTTAVEKVEKAEKAMEFVPFGAEQKIKLSISIVKNLLAVKTKSGRTCSDNDALKFMMMCKAKGLDPFESDAFLIGYDTNEGGTIIPKYSQLTAHQAFLKRAEVHPAFDGMKSGIILLTDEETRKTEDREGDFHLPDEIVVGGWATVYLKGKTHPVQRRLRMTRFNKGFGVWKDDAAGMIVKCAEADALRSAFPTKIGGLFLREEMDFPINVEAHAVELPTHRLVDVTPADSEPQTETAEPPQEQRREPAPAKSARADLAQFVVSEGFSFDDFQRWALESNNVPGADSITTFDEVPEADAKRIMRSKDGLKKGLALAKGTQ